MVLPYSHFAYFALFVVIRTPFMCMAMILMLYTTGTVGMAGSYVPLAKAEGAHWIIWQPAGI